MRREAIGTARDRQEVARWRDQNRRSHDAARRRWRDQWDAKHARDDKQPPVRPPKRREHEDRDDHDDQQEARPAAWVEAREALRVLGLLGAEMVRVADVLGIGRQKRCAAGTDPRMDRVHRNAPVRAPLIVHDRKVRIGGITDAAFEIDVSGLSCAGLWHPGIRRRRCGTCGSRLRERGNDEQRAHYGTTRVSPLSIRGISFGPSRLVSPRSAS